MAKKVKTKKHIVTEDDMKNNPELEKEGVKAGDEIEIPAEIETEDGETLALLRGLADSLNNVSGRLDGFEKRMVKMEVGDKDSFKTAAKPEEIEKASASRKGVDPKVCAIVDELLGTDFGIELNGLGDRPGFMFTLVVPDRLNDNVVDKRPVRDPGSGQYVKLPGGEVKMEDYKLPDRRSRVLSTSDSYDAVRQHCERVRSYIVAYYQKSNRPLPDLKVQ